VSFASRGAECGAFSYGVSNVAAATIHLQWFSDDNEAEGKTIDPTEHKLRKLREEGQVAKSQELVGALGLLLPALTIFFLAPSMLRTCVEMVHFFFSRAIELDPAKDAVIAAVFFRYLARLALPILAVAMVSAVFSNLVQLGGFLFTTKPIAFNFSKVLPRLDRYFGQIFSIDGLYKFFTSLAKMAIIGIVAFVLIYTELGKLVNLQKAGLWNGFTTVASLGIRLLLICALLLLILSIPDIMFQRQRFKERHKMSRQELKEEMRMYEADPAIQSRIRSRFQDLLRQNIAVTVPRADVVITNPTHFAVALEYRPELTGPMVTALGADEMAAQIKRIAASSGVPIVEDKPLARSLFHETHVGDIIPVIYWKAVAAVLSKVWHINEFRRSARELSA